MVWASFINSPAVRFLSFLTAGALLALSLFGLYHTLTTPTERQVTTPIVNYTHTGTYNYAVKLKPNSLFETTELGPGQTYFARLVDDLRMTYTYELTADEALENKQFTYQVTAFLGTEGLWERSFALVPPTTTDDDPFTMSFVVPIPQFLELIDAIREETRAATGPPRLTIRTRVQPEVQTPHGPITDSFEQELRFVFSDETMNAVSPLDATETNAITEVEVVTTPGLERFRLASMAGTVVALVLLSYLSWMFVQYRRQIPTTEKELDRARKQLKGLLVEAEAPPPRHDDQMIIRLNRLSDLINMAEETFQPVIYIQNEDGVVTYCVITASGGVRYEYVSCNASAVIGEQLSPQRERTEVTEGLDV